MIFKLSGELSKHNLIIGTKPAYVVLPTPIDLNVVCGCDNPHCHNHEIHGLKWDCTWIGKRTCDEVYRAINKRIAYWQCMMDLIEHKKPGMMYSCEIMRRSKMTKNVKNKIKLWKRIKKEIQSQIPADQFPINE